MDAMDEQTDEGETVNVQWRKTRTFFYRVEAGRIGRQVEELAASAFVGSSAEMDRDATVARIAAARTTVA